MKNKFNMAIYVKLYSTAVIHLIIVKQMSQDEEYDYLFKGSKCHIFSRFNR